MNLLNKMKVKKDKKSEKRVKDMQEQDDPTASDNPRKKFKLGKLKAANKGEAANDSKTVPVVSVEKSIKSVDTNIFKFFKDLTNDEEQTRMDAAMHLVQQLARTKEPEKRQKELCYALKRLIRGCGASTNVSRSGFFVGLVGFLKAFSIEEVSMQFVLDTLNKELHVGATIANKEDADAVVGKILIVGALLHSGRLAASNLEYIEQVTNMLLQSTRHRTYHASLGYSFLCEMIEMLSQKQFESAMWPLLQKELTIPWTKQNLQSVYCLITIQKKYPSVVNPKFLKTHFGGTELLNPEGFQALHKIFWEHSNTDILTHPAFESFGTYIASGKYLSQFWNEFVDTGLTTNPTKLSEIVTLKILTDILENLDVEKTNAHELLSDNFMRMFIEGLKNLKQKKDETLKAFYADFLEALAKCCTRMTKDGGKVGVIKRLILPPGIFNIEKFSNNRIVHQLINSLGEEGVKDIFTLYKSIFLGLLPKNAENSEEAWLNFERLNAGYMLQHLLQHKAVHAAYKWREEQLQFLLSCGVFHVNDMAEICKKDSAGSFSKDFGEQCQNMFYTCLQTKLSDVSEEQKLLFNLASFCHEKLMKKHPAKYLRAAKFDETLQKSWNLMFETVAESQKTVLSHKPSSKKKTSSGSKLQNVFNILILTMGLQLFREPEMAGPAIEDLLKCMQKIKQQSKNKKKANNLENKEEEREPEWIEVVVDLFLHLLSQNNSALRNIVNALFPHLFENLSLTAVHQILAMLDMKDGQNPLSSKNDDEEDDDDEDGEEEEVEEENINKTQVNGKDSDEETSSEDDDDDEDDEDDEDEDVDDADEETISAADKLRNAISQALMTTGAAATTIDDDMDSVDLNEMTEEEGRKLDEALANAFKALKKPAGSSQSKKSKSYRVKTTTVMHFRIRVLDLIDIYLQQSPILLISIEIMLALFNMLEYCVGDELKPLQTKVEKTLNKLTAIKNCATTTDGDLTQENFVDFLRLIVEKKCPAPAYGIVNRMRNKCCCFLINNANKVCKEQNINKILSLCQEYIQEFIKSRNPIVNITLISDIFKLHWRHVWDLAEDITEKGINQETRTFRRIQLYEILSILYRNHDIQKQDEAFARKNFKKIEKTLNKHIQAMSANTSIKHSPKEFQTLLELILHAQRAHQRLAHESILTSQQTLANLQNLRKLIRLESSQVYQRFCGTFKLKVIRNTEVQQNDKENADTDTESADETKAKRKAKKSKIENDEGRKEPETLSGQKRVLNAKDLHKLKKQKKQRRMEASSRGLNGGIGFTQCNSSTANYDVQKSDSDSS